MEGPVYIGCRIGLVGRASPSILHKHTHTHTQTHTFKTHTRRCDASGANQSSKLPKLTCLHTQWTETNYFRFHHLKKYAGEHCNITNIPPLRRVLWKVNLKRLLDWQATRYPGSLCARSSIAKKSSTCLFPPRLISFNCYHFISLDSVPSLTHRFILDIHTLTLVCFLLTELSVSLLDPGSTQVSARLSDPPFLCDRM